MNEMVQKIFKIIDCPEKKWGCSGLAIAISGEGIEVEQRDNRYIVKTRDGHEAFGNCLNYQQCYQKVILQGERKSAIIKLDDLNH